MNLMLILNQYFSMIRRLVSNIILINKKLRNYKPYTSMGDCKVNSYCYTPHVSRRRLYNSCYQKNLRSNFHIWTFRLVDDEWHMRKFWYFVKILNRVVTKYNFLMTISMKWFWMSWYEYIAGTWLATETARFSLSNIFA